MGDDKQQYFTIQVKGEAMRFTPISSDDSIMVQTLVAMEAGQSKIFRGLMRILKDASTEEQWDRLSDRVVNRELALPEIMNIFKRLTERTVKASQAGDGKGLDVASTTLVPNDAE